MNYIFSGEVTGVELYDYERDPNESRNLAGYPEYVEALETLQNAFTRRLAHLPPRTN